jgi:bifunctional DNA-binding transcriptional regulator/antitoxin component of YhaV-PrlF toxin-antitoxin module
MRHRYGLRTGCEVEFEEADGGVLIRPASSQQAERIAAAIASVRGCADAGLTTAAIMQTTRD